MATINDWGAFLSKHNLTSDMLLSDNLSITATDVTNDLYEFVNRHSGCTLDSFRRWLALLIGYNWPVIHFPTSKSLTQNVIRLSSRLTNLKKEHNSQVKDALIKVYENYCLPKYMIHGKLHTLSSSSTNDISNSTSSSCSELASDNELLKSKNAQLLLQIETHSKTIKEAREKCKESKQKLYSVYRNSRKKVLQREEQLKNKKNGTYREV